VYLQKKVGNTINDIDIFYFTMDMLLLCRIEKKHYLVPILQWVWLKYFK